MTRILTIKTYIIHSINAYNSKEIIRTAVNGRSNAIINPLCVLLPGRPSAEPRINPLWGAFEGIQLSSSRHQASTTTSIGIINPRCQNCEMKDSTAGLLLNNSHWGIKFYSVLSQGMSFFLWIQLITELYLLRVSHAHPRLKSTVKQSDAKAWGALTDWFFCNKRPKMNHQLTCCIAV